MFASIVSALSGLFKVIGLALGLVKDYNKRVETDNAKVDGKAELSAEQAALAAKEKAEAEKAKQDVEARTDAELDAALSKWVR